MLYSFDAKNADAPSRHHTQYFEMMGDHAIYHDGWIASTKVMRAPWDVAGPAPKDPAGYPYELYDLSHDWTQYEDVAAKYPDKLKEMEKLFWQEASKYQVLPLDSSSFTRAVAPRPSLAVGKTQFTWTGPVTGTPNGDAPSILDTSYNFKAEVEIPPGGAEGMIVTQGGRFGGYGLYLLKGKPVFLYNLVDLKRTRWEGRDALTPGKHTLEFDFHYDGLGMGTLAFNNVSGIGRGGVGVLKVDGKEVARQRVEHTMPLTMQWDENFDIGADTGTPVSNDYQVPFKFTGKLNNLTLDIDRPQLSAADIQKLKAAQRNNRASE
jgi:arylsulfatase